MTYNNEEVFPIIKRVAPPNVSVDSVIRGSGNIISKSARNVIVSGDNNVVELEAENISMLNCSGCIVASGVIGSTLINCSGISIYEDNLVYINNQQISTANTSSDGYRKSTTFYTIMTTADGTIDAQYSGGVGTSFLPNPVGHNKKFTIKNNSPTFHDEDVMCTGYSIDNSATSGVVTLAYLDSITVQSDGVSNYLII